MPSCQFFHKLTWVSILGGKITESLLSSSVWYESVSYQVHYFSPLKEIISNNKCNISKSSWIVQNILVDIKKKKRKGKVNYWANNLLKKFSLSPINK